MIAEVILASNGSYTVMVDDREKRSDFDNVRSVQIWTTLHRQHADTIAANLNIAFRQFANKPRD